MDNSDQLGDDQVLRKEQHGRDTKMQDKRIPYLAAGLLTQAEAKVLVDDLKKEFDLAVVEDLFRAFRSMTVAVVESRASEWELSDWASVIRHVTAALGRSFEGAAERFLTLRFMLTEAAERAGMGASDDHKRQGMMSLISTLQAAPEGLSLRELEVLGDAPYAIAQRLRIALASGTVKLAGNWRERRFAATGQEPNVREDYPPRAELVSSGGL
jgi:hypothetical protein